MVTTSMNHRSMPTLFFFHQENPLLHIASARPEALDERAASLGIYHFLFEISLRIFPLKFVARYTLLNFYILVFSFSFSVTVDHCFGL